MSGQAIQVGLENREEALEYARVRPRHRPGTADRFVAMYVNELTTRLRATEGLSRDRGSLLRPAPEPWRRGDLSSRAVILCGRAHAGRPRDGAPAGVRPDDLAAVAIAAAVSARGAGGRDRGRLVRRANQAGEDNRNVARMAALLAGLPESVAGVTVNRLCASGLSAVTARHA